MRRFWKVQPALRPVMSIRGTRDKHSLVLEVEGDATGGQPDSFTAPKTWEDILDAVLALRRALGRAATYSPNNFAILDEAERKDAVREIAEKGHHLFLMLFAEGSPVHEGFKRVVQSDMTLQVVTKEAATFIPWEFLYPHPVGEEADPKLFLAHNMVFSGVVPTSGPIPNRGSYDFTPADPLRKRAPGQGPVKAGRILDDRLESIAEPDQWFTDHWPVLDVVEFAPLSPAAIRKTEADKLQAFLTGNADIYHFDCDAQPNASGTRTNIRISTDFLLGQPDVDDWDFSGNVDVLLVLNFCSSHSSPYWDIPSVAAKLQSKYAGAVISILSDVNDMLAWLFAREFYESLFSSNTVGDALLQSRRSLLTKSNGNPAAYLFSMFGAASLRPSEPLPATV